MYAYLRTHTQTHSHVAQAIPKYCARECANFDLVLVCMVLKDNSGLNGSTYNYVCAQ